MKSKRMPYYICVVIGDPSGAELDTYPTFEALACLDPDDRKALEHGLEAAIDKGRVAEYTVKNPPLVFQDRNAIVKVRKALNRNIEERLGPGHKVSLRQQ